MAGRSIIKAAPGTDLYLVRSSVTDGILFAGGRAQVRRWLIQDAVEQARQRAVADVDQMFEWANGHGSTGSTCWWSEEHLLVSSCQAGPDGKEGWWAVPRADLATYAFTIMDGDEEAAQKLTVFIAAEDDAG